MSSQIPNDLANRVPENIPAHVEEAVLPVDNVASVAMGVLSNPQFGAGPSSGESSAVSLSPLDLNEQDVQARALPFMQGNISGLTKATILNDIRLIPSGDREDVIKRALSLMQDDTDGWSKAGVLNAIRETPSGEREDVIQRALPLIQGDMDGREKAFILDAIQKIPSEERQDVIKRALPLMQDDTDGWSKAGVLNAIRKTLSEERQDVIQRALPLMEGDMDGWNKAEILSAIQKIPSGEREDVIQRTLPLIQDDVSGSSKACILKAIQKIPSEEQENIIQLALPLMQSNMSESHKVKILDAIRMVPVAERNPRAARALEQIQIDFPPEQQAVRLNIYLARVRYLLETPLNEAFLPMRQNNVMAAAAAAGHAVINVHAGSRDARTAQALQLLRQSQQMTSEKIETASKACIKYLEDHERDRALKVLIGPENPDDYGPFFKPFIINGIETSGQEVIGRLWQFIQNLSPEQEKEAALHSMVISLSECINEHGERVCDQGKMQHLLIAVLQGRLKGVRIDDSIEIPEAAQEQNAPKSISVEAAIEIFFHVETNRAIKDLQTLLQAAALFCNENPSVDPELFITEIRNYAEQSQIYPS